MLANWMEDSNRPPGTRGRSGESRPARPCDKQGRTAPQTPTGGGRYFKYRPPLALPGRWIEHVWPRSVVDRTSTVDWVLVFPIRQRAGREPRQGRATAGGWTVRMRYDAARRRCSSSEQPLHLLRRRRWGAEQAPKMEQSRSVAVAHTARPTPCPCRRRAPTARSSSSTPTPGSTATCAGPSTAGRFGSRRRRSTSSGRR